MEHVVCVGREDGRTPRVSCAGTEESSERPRPADAPPRVQPARLTVRLNVQRHGEARVVRSAAVEVGSGAGVDAPVLLLRPGDVLRRWRPTRLRDGRWSLQLRSGSGGGAKSERVSPYSIPFAMSRRVWSGWACGDPAC